MSFGPEGLNERNLPADADWAQVAAGEAAGTSHPLCCAEDGGVN